MGDSDGTSPPKTSTDWLLWDVARMRHRRCADRSGL